MQARTGRTNEWEDPIYNSLGQDWRHQRDVGMDKKGWKVTTGIATIGLLTKSNMSMGKPEMPQESWVHKRRKTENFLEPHPPQV